ncbi:unnamed protein product [Brassica oleracea var. botrytis]
MQDFIYAELVVYESLKLSSTSRMWSRMQGTSARIFAQNRQICFLKKVLKVE